MGRSSRSRVRKQPRNQRRSHHKSRRDHSQNNRSISPDYTQLLQRRLDALETLVRATHSRDSSESALRRTKQTSTRSRSPYDSEVNNKQRYVGRTELIPEFDGTSNSLTIRQWVTKIDEIGELYHWDDRAKIFAMIGRLTGNAKSWYDCQSELNSPDWNSWKEKLMRAFPSSKGIAANLKEFVNSERKPNEDVVSFYYSKLRLGKHCELPDHVIADVIIFTLNDSILKASAYAASCKTTEQLLKFLVESNYAGTNKEIKRQQPQNRVNNSNKVGCFICGKVNHKAASCYLRKSDKNNDPRKTTLSCTFCKKSGHTRDNCFSLKSRADLSTKINIVSVDDAKYHVTAKINDVDVSTYIDFGSACNVIKLNTAKSLGLPINTTKQTTMRGYGGAVVTSLGETFAKVKIDEVERDVPILVVDDVMQDMELLIGRTFTETPNLLVIKTNEKLEFQNENEHL